MRRNHADNENSEIRMELKYCEHCGGLYVRERGSGVVYCEKCEDKVADLPIPKKKPGKVQLSVRPWPPKECRVDVSKEELRDMEAVGGVA